MLELLEWGKKRDDDTADPGSGPRSAGPSLAGPIDGDPATVLADLDARLEAAGGAGGEPKSRSESLALIQETSGTIVIFWPGSGYPVISAMASISSAWTARGLPSVATILLTAARSIFRRSRRSS